MRREPTVRLLPAALQAIDDQTSFYASVSESDLYQRWERAVDASLESLLAVPEGGAPMWFPNPLLVGLRRWPITGFPNHLLVYRYLPEQNMLIVIDVPHGSRDLQARLSLILEEDPSQ